MIYFKKIYSNTVIIKCSWIVILSDKGKLVESQGRKAIGPVKWQPVTERKFKMKK